MKISGFTIVRNGVKYDYPFIEAIQSVLPVCDEFIVVVGNSEDETREKIVNLDNSKIKIVDTTWDENLREEGLILAQQTNIALDHISGDWGFYIQADEVLHEKFLSKLKEQMEKYHHEEDVEGLLFDYKHFYGSYNYIGVSRRWYRREVRVIKNDKAIYSYRDAQGFRKKRRKLNVKHIPCEIYHYGWVKHPKTQQDKQRYFHKLWHDDEWMKKNIPDVNQYDYSVIDALSRFSGTHPKVMQERIDKADWEFQYNIDKKKFSVVEKILWLIEQGTGFRPFEYKNYKII
ncbi:MAG: glycosyltransferase [Cytophagales bacterium]|nr:glycosyltransferase [Cytophagales bacterium]